MTEKLDYLHGFGAAHLSEVLEGAVPRHQSSPRQVPYGLHAEQLNGVSFTVPRAHNSRTWLYRIRPSVGHGELEPVEHTDFGVSYLDSPPGPNLLGFRPRPLPASPGVDFLASLQTVAGAGDPAREHGLAVHTYACNADMGDVALYSADGDLMIVPDTGILRIRTELGVMRVSPGQLAVIQRGMLMNVALEGDAGRGLVVEVYARHFELPERGVIGANGLADERHFQSPVASYEDREVEGGYRVVAKMAGKLWEARRSHSPFDVVGWHGSYLPYRYELSRFNAMGSVTWDHPDPSIFTVLSAPLDHPGENLADLVVFPNPRWDVAQGTFRPPYYHRNAATELNALVAGPTNPERVFTRGGYFYTPPFTAHGVRPEVVEKWYAMSDDEANEPQLNKGGHLWIQFESTLPLSFSRQALDSNTRDRTFREFASGVRSYFDPNTREPEIPS